MKNFEYPAIKTQLFDCKLIPTVSVCMFAYNAEEFISEAIESVLSQKANFKVELVIGEDCSTDKTRLIALEYQKKYPNIIRVLLHEKNMGLTLNHITTHNVCIGKYIAMLDGDDYWTDDCKLQKQNDFLEKNIDYSGYGHQATVIYNDNSKAPHNFGNQQNVTFGLEDSVGYRKFHTSSIMYRKEIWDKTGGIPKNILSNDRAVYIMISLFGKIFYDSIPMCVYRKNSMSLSSRITYKELETDFGMIPWIRSISKLFPIVKFKSFLHFCVYTNPKKMPLIIIFNHFFLFFFLSFSYFPKNLGDIKFGVFELVRILKGNFT